VSVAGKADVNIRPSNVLAAQERVKREQLPGMVRHKNEYAPTGASHEFDPAAFMRCPDSPPSLSLTNSPGERTDDKQTNIVSARDLKMAGKDQLKVNFIFRCLSCNKSHAECFVPYDFDDNFGNCEACGCF
jgi:hypothetical protein